MATIQPDDGWSRGNDRLTMTGSGDEYIGTIGILASIVLGLVLAGFMMISAQSAILALSSGAILAITVLLRKVTPLIIVWMILSTFIMLITTRLFPEHHSFVGRGIFWGLLGCVVVALTLDNIFKGRQFIPFDNVWLKGTLAIFVLWAALGVLTSLDHLNTVKQVSKFVIGVVVSYMFYDFFSRAEKNIRIVLRVISLLIIAVAIVTVGISIEALLSGVPIFKRIRLWFWNPNSLGTFLFLGIPILISTGRYVIVNRAMRVFVIGVVLLALFLSFHRTSWVATSACILFLLLRGRMRVPIWLAVIAGLFISALLFPVVGDDFYDYITGERYTGRKEIWQGSLKAAYENPVLGVGAGNSLMIISDYIDTPWLKRSDTHSVYFKNAVEMGVMSVGILLSVYVIFLQSALRIERNLRSDYLRLVTRGIVATFLGLLVHGVFENGFFLTAFSAAEFTVILPYVLIGLPYACKKLEESERLAT